MRKSIIIVTILFNILACSKDGQNDVAAIPYIEVDERIDINDPLYQNLNNIGGWAYITAAGSRGIILYRVSTEIVKAYERQCTFDPTSVCSTTDVDPFTLQVNDNDCCGSIFNLTNGIVFQGPATIPLKQYSASIEGTYIVVVN